MAISRDLADKLAQICVGLSSSFDDERAAAGLMASRALRDAGLSWRHLIEAAATGTAPAAPAPATPMPAPTASAFDGGQADHLAVAKWALSYPHLLNDWQRKFLGSILAFRQISDKQRVILDRTVDSLRSRGAAL